MILVDSSVWIDYLRGTKTRQTDRLHALLGVEPLAIGDLILTEVLQGTTSDKAFRDVLRLLGSLDVVQLGGQAVAVRRPGTSAPCARKASPSARPSTASSPPAASWMS